MFSLRSIRPPVLPFTLLMLVACTQVSPTPDSSASLNSQGVSYSAQDLGTLGDSETYAQGVSADGTTIVGQSETYYSQNFVHTNAFVWTEAGGIQKLGTLPEQYETRAYGVSADGTKIVGQSPFNNYSHAAIWTKAGSAQNLGTLSTEDDESTAYGISADGTTVVGQSESSEPNVPLHAFRWTKAGGMQDLGTLGGQNSAAYAASANGSTVIGESQVSTSYYSHAFRWTEKDGIRDLGTLGGSYSVARGVSADGRTVVGYSTTNPEDTTSNAPHAFIWTEAGGMKDLGTLSGASISYAQGVSADGKTVVGYSSTNGNGIFRAFRWTAATGMQSLTTLPDSSNDYAYGISADGSTVVGRSQLPGHEIHATRWIVANPTPESTTYTADFERAPTSRPLYSLRVGQGVTGPITPGRISVSGKRLIGGEFRGGQYAKVVDLYGSKRLVVVGSKSGSTPNAGGGQLQFIFNAGAGFGDGSVTVKSLTLSNVTATGATVNLYRGRTLVQKVAVPITGAGQSVTLTINELDVTIVSAFARFPMAVDELIFEE